MGHNCAPGCCYESTWLPRVAYETAWTTRRPAVIVDRDPGDEHRPATPDFGPTLYDTIVERARVAMWAELDRLYELEFARIRAAMPALPVFKFKFAPTVFDWDPFGIGRALSRRALRPPIVDRDPGDEA